MCVRFEILVLGVLCSVVVPRLTHAQTPDSTRTDNAIWDIKRDIPKDETSAVPAHESPDPDSLSISGKESVTPPVTSRSVDSRRRDQFERALPHIVKAEGLFENDMFEAAAAEYKRASEILEGHPKYYQTQYNLGLCFERLSRYTEALKYYENHLRSPHLETTDRFEVEKTVKTLRELLATLRIFANVDATVWVDGRLIGQAPGKLLVAGGRHRVELHADGYETEQLEVRVPAQTVRRLTFQMKAIERFQKIDPIYFWLSSALAVTAIGVGSYFGIDAILEDDKAQKKYDALFEEGSILENDPPEKKVEDQLKRDNQRIEDLQIKADIFFAIGGGFVLSSIVLFFLTDWDASKESRVKPSLSIIPSVSPHGVEGNLTGYFETPFL